MNERIKIISTEEAVMHFGKKYVYRIASVNVNKATLEKYILVMNKNLDNNSYSFKINDDTYVGSVTQKVSNDIVDIITLGVDNLVIDLTVKDGEVIEVTYI